MRRFLGAVFLAVLACGDQGSEKTLNYFFTYDPRSLDPALSTDVPTGEVVALLFDNLTQFDPDGGWSRGWPPAGRPMRRGRIYTFHLRTGAALP